MTQRQFDASIKQLLDEYLDRAIARVKRLQQIKSGSRDVHRVRVREPKRWSLARLAPQGVDGRERQPALQGWSGIVAT
jgi:hypothetical protein